MKDAVQENYDSDHDSLALNPCKKYESVHIHIKKERKMRRRDYKLTSRELFL